MPSDGETPVRMTLTDLQSAESVEVMYNPTELKRILSTNYARKAVLGNSHQPHEFLNTNNQNLTFTLWHRAENPEELNKLQDAMRFIESLHYAPEAPDSITQNAPPRVLMVWPRTLSLTVRVLQTEITHMLFNRFGDTTQFTARITADEALLKRLTKEDVRLLGALRTPQNEGKLIE